MIVLTFEPLQDAVTHRDQHDWQDAEDKAQTLIIRNSLIQEEMSHYRLEDSLWRLQSLDRPTWSSLESQQTEDHSSDVEDSRERSFYEESLVKAVCYYVDQIQ